MKYNKLIVTIFITALINGAVVAAWLYFFYAISNTGAEITTIRQTISFNEKRMENNRLLNDLVIDLVDEKEKIDSVFLDEENIVDLVEEIEYVAEQVGASINFGQVSISGSNKNKEAPRAQFSLTGDFSQLFQALVLLENLSYAIDIQTVVFRNIKTTKWAANFNVELNNFFELSIGQDKKNSTKDERS